MSFATEYQEETEREFLCVLRVLWGESVLTNSVGPT